MTGRHHEDSGFTLIELLIVIVILGVLATVVVFAVGGITDRGSTAAAAADAKTLETAEESHMAQFGSYTDEATLHSIGLLRDESDLHDITVAADGSDYTIVAAGSAPPDVPSPTTAPAPPTPVAASYAASTGLSLGSGAKTLVIIGDGINTGALWSDLQATPLADTTVIWLNAADVQSAAAIDAVVASGPDYIVAADTVAISGSPLFPYVGTYMNSKWPGTFWWTHNAGRNPTVAELQGILGITP
jgi:general secretion pathway protein G